MRTFIYTTQQAAWSFWLLFLVSITLNAQQINWYNLGVLHLDASAKVVSYGDFENKTNARFINDGKITFKKDVTNHGYFSFHEEGEREVVLQSEEKQNLQGSRPILFYHLTLNNHSILGVQISTDVEVHGVTDFEQGVLHNRETAGQIRFQTNASVQGVSSLSFIDGFVSRIGKGNFVYPIGHQGYYRKLNIYGNTGDTDNYVAVYHKENSDTYFPHVSKQKEIALINEEEYWELLDYQTSDHVYIQFYLSEETTPDIFLDNISQISIVAWDTKLAKWISLETIVDSSTKSLTSLFKTTIYGAYTMALKTSELEEESIEIFNAVNPKDIHGNQYFRIEGIHAFPDNELKIYNRWGALVYQTRAYDTQENVFEGISEGNITISKNKQLPEGTYFYVLKRLHPIEGKRLTNTGYLYLIR